MPYDKEKTFSTTQGKTFRQKHERFLHSDWTMKFFKNDFKKKDINIPSFFIHGHVECSSDNPAWLCLPKSLKFVSQGPENTGKKNKSFFKIALWHREDSSDHPAKHFEKSLKVFCPVTEILIFLERLKKKKKKSLKMFPWTRRKQFWQPCRKVFAKRSKTVPQMSNKKEGKFQKTKKKLRFFYRHLKCCFDNPTWNVSTESRIDFQKGIFWKKMMIP